MLVTTAAKQAEKLLEIRAVGHAFREKFDVLHSALLYGYLDFAHNCASLSPSRPLDSDLQLRLIVDANFAAKFHHVATNSASSEAVGLTIRRRWP